MLNAAPAAQLSARTFVLTRRSAKGHDDLSCWLALPDTVSTTLPPLVAVHGIRREADARRNFLANGQPPWGGRSSLPCLKRNAGHAISRPFAAAVPIWRCYG